MFSASKAYFEGMEHRSNETILEGGVRRLERRETIALGEGAGNLAVSRTASVHSYEHLSPDVTMYFQPPHPEYGSQATFRGDGRLGDIGGRSVADRLVRSARHAAAGHDAEIARQVEAAQHQAPATA